MLLIALGTKTFSACWKPDSDEANQIQSFAYRKQLISQVMIASLLHDRVKVI